MTYKEGNISMMAFDKKKERRVIHSNKNKSDLLLRMNSVDHMIFEASTPHDPIDLPPPMTWPIVLENDGTVLEKVDKLLEILYPKVLAVVDHTIFEHMQRSLANILKYVTLFWNEIDETYAKIVHPKVELSLAGVVIANNEKSLDFIYNSTSFLNDGPTYINVTRYATNAANYFYRDFSEDLQFDNYHAAAVMTKMQLKDNAVTSDGEILGYTNSIGNICRRGLNGAVGTDDGMFFGVDTFTHELGHLLNMMHDNTDNSFNKCDPTLENHKNEWVSQSVMAWDYGLPLHWTNCSIQSLTRLASYKAGQCLGSC